MHAQATAFLQRALAAMIWMRWPCCQSDRHVKSSSIRYDCRQMGCDYAAGAGFLVLQGPFCFLEGDFLLSRKYLQPHAPLVTGFVTVVFPFQYFSRPVGLIWP